MLGIPSNPEPNVGPPWLRPEKNFKMEVLKWLENAILRLIFAHTVFYERAILLLFSFYSVSPDTHFGTDFRLIVSATGLLCNSILPVVTLCVVLHVVFVIVR